MIIRLHSVLSVAFVALTVLAGCAKKDDGPAPDTTPNYTTQQYLATLNGPAQIFQVDTQLPFRGVGRQGTIIEIAAQAFNNGQTQTPITGTVELELREAASRKDIITNGLSLHSYYMAQQHGLLRFTQAFALDSRQNGNHPGGRVTVKVPFTDPTLAQTGRVQLLEGMYIGDTTIVNGFQNWAPTGLVNVFGNYQPAATDAQTGRSYHQLPGLQMIPQLWMSVADLILLVPNTQGSVLNSVYGNWTSPSAVLPVIYVLPPAQLSGARMKVAQGQHQFYQDRVYFPFGMVTQLVGVQYDHGKIYYGRQSLTIGPGQSTLAIHQVSEAELVAALNAL